MTQAVLVVPREGVEPLQAESGYRIRTCVRRVLEGTASNLPEREPCALMQIRREIDEATGPIPEVLQREGHDLFGRPEGSRIPRCREGGKQGIDHVHVVFEQTPDLALAIRGGMPHSVFL